MVRFFITVFYSLFALIGLAALLYSLWSVYMTQRAEAWTSTTGTVVRAYCYATPGNSSWIRRVWYQYQVGGKSYKSDREHFGIAVGSTDCVVGYSKGQAVSVYYNPAHPGEAVLKPVTTTSTKLGIVFGLVFMGLSAFGYWITAKDARRDKS